MPKASAVTPCGFRIGTWLSAQKRKLGQSRLESHQIKALDDAAPRWRDDIPVDPTNLKKALNPREREWDEAFLEMLSSTTAFVNDHDRFPREQSISLEERRLAR